MKELPAFAGQALCSNAPTPSALSEAPRELGQLLELRNGFEAFERSLVVLPLGESRYPDLAQIKKVMDEGYVSDWNPSWWPFAFDAFGMPFVIDPTGIVRRFNPETGEIEWTGDDLEAWCALLVEDTDDQTGRSLLLKWKSVEGPVGSGQFLGPKVPFAAGGRYEVENLYPATLLELTTFRTDLHSQIRDLPDGTKLRLSLVDESAGR